MVAGGCARTEVATSSVNGRPGGDGLPGGEAASSQEQLSTAQPVYNLDQTQMRGLLVRPPGTSYHLEKPPRIFFPPGLPNEMVTIPAAANKTISYISRIRNVYFGSFSGCAALTPW